MSIKDKFAALLRRWASKLSPGKCPDLPNVGLNLPSPSGEAIMKFAAWDVYLVFPKKKKQRLL